MAKAMKDSDTKNKADIQAKNMANFEAYAKSQGKELKYSMGPGGMSASTVEPKDLTMQNYKLAAMGSRSNATRAGKDLGIQPETLAPENTPGAFMSTDSGSGDPNEFHAGGLDGQLVAPVQEDYTQTVKKYLQGAMPDLRKKSPKASFEKDLIDTQNGDNTWDNLISTHPTKSKQIVEQFRSFAERKGEVTGTDTSSSPSISKFKEGDTKVVGAITYKRNGQGQWLPQS